MPLDILIIPSNVYIDYVLRQFNQDYNITELESTKNLYSNYYLTLLPIILCTNFQEFLFLKTTIYREKLIFISENQKLLWKYQIVNPFKVDKLFSLISNLSSKKVFKINDELLFFYNQAELIFNQSSKLNLTSLEADILYEIIVNNSNCSKTLLTSKLWPKYKTEHANKNLDNYIYKLRKKLELVNLIIDMTTKNDSLYYQLIKLNS